MFTGKRNAHDFVHAVAVLPHKRRTKPFFAALLSLSLVFAAGLGGCSYMEQSDKGQSAEPPKQTMLQTREPVYTLMGIAAYKSFDASVKQTAKALADPNAETQAEDEAETDNASGADADELKISYPFDYLKILSAVKFSAEFPDTPDFLQTYCGEGELEYVIAEFETYIGDGEVLPAVADTLLAVRGSKGYYCSLSNSYLLGNAETGLEEGAHYYAFSSHKKLGETSVDKDFTPPVYMLYTKENPSGFSVAYGQEEGLRNVGKDTVFTQMTGERAERATSGNLYGTEELSRLPQAEMTGVVKSVEKTADGVWVTLSDASPSRVLVDAAAEWVDANGQTARPEELAAGDTLTAFFDDLFEGYAPDRVRANKVFVQKSQKNFDKAIDKGRDS